MILTFVSDKLLISTIIIIIIKGQGEIILGFNRPYLFIYFYKINASFWSLFYHETAWFNKNIHY